MHMNPVMIYDQSTAPGGRVTFTGILAHLESRLDRAPAFRQKLVGLPLGLAVPYWVDDPDFDLEYHVRHIALPKPGDWRQFCIQIARLHSRPLDLTRPPWELTVIEGLDAVEGVPPGSFALSLKVHHSVIDGETGVQLLNVLHDSSPTAPSEATSDVWRPEQAPGMGSLARFALRNAVAYPLRAARLAGRHVPREIKAIAPTVLQRDRSPRGSSQLTVPKSRFNQPVSQHRVFDSAYCDFEVMRRIKSAVPGATINDVALAIVGGALRRYLTEHDDLPADSLIAICPISLRTPGDAEGGNLVTTMRQPLRTDLGEPLERLAAIQAVTSVDREARKGVRARALLEVSGLLPGALMGLSARMIDMAPDRMPLTANAMVTNVPGSRSPLYLCGAEQLHQFGNGPLTHGMGLIHLVGSYKDEFAFSITADRELMPDPAFYRECLVQSIQEFVAALSERSGDDAAEQSLA
jgi:diacylglycerol O-acyltransferase